MQCVGVGADVSGFSETIDVRPARRGGIAANSIVLNLWFLAYLDARSCRGSWSLVSTRKYGSGLSARAIPRTRQG